MQTRIQTILDGFRARRATVLSAVALAVGFCLSGATPAEGNPADNAGSLKARQEIEDLEYCYANGTDAIGRGNYALGKQIYEKCFTSDAEIDASFPHDDPNTPPDLVTTGPDSWADIVQNVFVTAGYQYTQHTLTNIQVDINGNHATSKSYLTANHILDPMSSFIIAHGTYENEVVHTNHGWRIKKRSLHLISFIPLSSP